MTLQVDVGVGDAVWPPPSSRVYPALLDLPTAPVLAYGPRVQGKRGGLRVIYYYFAEDTQIWFLTLYGKDEASDLTPKERQILKTHLEEEKRQRAQLRAARRK